jgi:hypothetical protein
MQSTQAISAKLLVANEQIQTKKKQLREGRAVGMKMDLPAQLDRSEIRIFDDQKLLGGKSREIVAKTVQHWFRHSTDL